MTADLTARLAPDAAHAQTIARGAGRLRTVQWLLARLGERDAALRAVLKRHRPSAYPHHGGPHHGKTVCVECSSHGWADDNPPGEPYPCPTVTDVVSALSGGAE